MNRHSAISETRRKRSLHQRMLIVQGVLAVAGLIIVARLIELQIVRGASYHEMAQAQHFGGVVLPARRGEILSRSSKTGETTILATNTTLDLVYVDPVVTDDPELVASTLADILVTAEFHEWCSVGDTRCPRELQQYYSDAFDPIKPLESLLSATGALLAPLPEELPPIDPALLPDHSDVIRRFSTDIFERIAEKRVTFVPLKYGATKVEVAAIQALNRPGVYASDTTNIVYANPELVPQSRVSQYSKELSLLLNIDRSLVRSYLRSRPLRYVPVMRQLPPILTAQVREAMRDSQRATREKRAQAPSTEAAQAIADPLRSIALIPEHWRFYPDGTVASHVVGFLNTQNEPQYGIERTFQMELRGQEGLIRTMSDPTGGQILTSQQRIVDPKDGSTIVLTIDREVQGAVERILSEAIIDFDADSGQAIVMDPETGKVIAMASAPLFDSNNYGTVYSRVPIHIPLRKRPEVVVELYHPQTLQFVLKGYWGDILTEQGRNALSPEKQQQVKRIEQEFNLRDVVRYYMYAGENSRREIFPTEHEEIWLTYQNNIGVGAYLNRSVQEIYEPGSVLKPITIAIALDQGEIRPSDTYDDDEPVEVDEYTIRNALNKHFGTVTMTECLEYSVNTCMTTVSTKLGRKLFHRMLERFGFGAITGIELEDELQGEILPWRNWSNALLATASYGQGISSTPMQVITAYTPLANHGRLMQPTIIDSILHSDGTVERTKPHVRDQVLTPETSETISAMLVSTVNNGFAKTARVPGYRLAGKTGTSQIAGPGGRYEAGTGSSITSFAGYGPIPDPKFLILVKIDRPRAVEYGSESAAPVFKQIAAYLLEYYGIPPQE